MSLATWLLFGAGIFLIYSAWRGNNPLAMLGQAFGVAPSAVPVSTPRYGVNGVR